MTDTEAIVAAISSIPPGKVASYAGIAELAGIPRGARQVARILHSCSEKYNLPWWRVVLASGEIALPGAGGLAQKKLLLNEGVVFRSSHTVDLRHSGYFG